ncbi:hypothetical protein ILUMI_19123, partial [Ignelater luminosus]
MWIKKKIDRVVVLPPNAGDSANQDSDIVQVADEEIFQSAGELEIEDNTDFEQDLEKTQPVNEKDRRISSLSRRKYTFDKVIAASDISLSKSLLKLDGYHSVPEQNYYWSIQPDLGVGIVSKTMSKNRYFDIKRYIHFADNENLMQDDEMSKIVPLYSFLNKNFLQFGMFHELLCIDEFMVPYYGRHVALFNLAVVAKPSPQALRQLIDQANTHIEAFKVLDVPLENNPVYKKKTHLGWVVGGRWEYLEQAPQTSMHVLDDQLTKFWELEECQNANVINADGHSVVRLPFKADTRQLDLSRQNILNGLFMLESEYNRFMDEYLILGHMHLADLQGND